MTEKIDMYKYSMGYAHEHGLDTSERDQTQQMIDQHEAFLEQQKKLESQNQNQKNNDDKSDDDDLQEEQAIQNEEEIGVGLSEDDMYFHTKAYAYESGQMNNHNSENVGPVHEILEEESEIQIKIEEKKKEKSSCNLI